jgi:uncharacterized protein YejL (UPF0352 family)
MTEDGKLVLNIEHYLTTITATLDHGKLVGNVVAQNRENELRSALAEAFADARLASVRERLLLVGLDLAPDVTFRRVLKLERDAASLNYVRVRLSR